MLKRLLLFAILLAPAPAHAAITVVQEATCSGNDCTATFASAPSASNKVLIAVMGNNATDTISITGAPNAVTTIRGPIVNTTTGYVFCYQGDGADTDFVATTSGTASARVAAIEISGGSCAEDGTGSGTTDTALNTHTSPSVTLTDSGSILIGIEHCTSTCNQDVDSCGATCIPSSNTDIGNQAMGVYKLPGASGAQNVTWHTTAGESTAMIVAAVKPAATTSCPATLALLGVGC